MRSLYWVGIATCLIEAGCGIYALAASGGHPYGCRGVVMSVGPAALSLVAMTWPRTTICTLAIMPQAYFAVWSTFWLVLYACNWVAERFAEPAMGTGTMLTHMVMMVATIVVAVANIVALSVRMARKARVNRAARSARSAAARKRRPLPGGPETGIKPAPKHPEMICRVPARKSSHP